MRSASDSTTTRRDAWLLTLLPALVVVVGYALFVRPSLARDREELEQRVAEARRGTPTPGEESELQRRRDALLERFEARKAEFDERRRVAERQRAASGSTAARKPRGETDLALARLWAEHGLALVAESPGDARAQQDEESSGRAAAAGGSRRTVELRGKYKDVEAAMRALPDSAPGVVPVVITLRAPTEEGGLPRWTLVLQ